MPTKHILQNFSEVLRSSTAAPHYYEFSGQVGKLDTFLSHTWNTPGFAKFLVLALHYNLSAALVISVAAAFFVSILTAHGSLPSVLAVGLVTEVEKPVHRGILSLPVGLTAFFISLFALHELDRFRVPWKRKSIFLDRCCIHQTDAELKKKGIESLAAFLCHSREILVCYSDNYLQRLWTTYEVASWLVLRRGDPMTVRPVFAPKPVLAGCLATTIPCVLWTILSILKARDPEVTTSLAPAAVCFSLQMVSSMASFWMLAWIAARWTAAFADMESQVANFRLADAQCFCEADRALVVQNIKQFMQLCRFVEPTAPVGEVTRIFEELVHREVPGLIRMSMGRVSIPYTWILVLRLPNTLASLDWAAGWPLDGRSGPYIVGYCLFYVMLILGVRQLVDAALIIVCSMFPSVRRCWGYVSLGAIGLFAQTVLFYLFDSLTQRALKDCKWLVALTFSYTILTVVTFRVFHKPLLSISS